MEQNGNEQKKERHTISLDEWFSSFALEIELFDEDSFLKIKETLTRIGVSSSKEHKLYQSCHILSKRDKYFLVHFKELFCLDGKGVDISENDILRRNCIACLLEEWGMLSIVNPENIRENKLPVTAIKVLKYAEKDEWELIPKYQIGNKNKKRY